MYLLFAILVLAVWATSCPLCSPLPPRVRRPLDDAQVVDADDLVKEALDQLLNRWI